MDINFNQLWGIGLIIVGLVWMYRRQIGLGIEGRAPSLYVNGKVAFALGLIALLVGIYFVLAS